VVQVEAGNLTLEPGAVELSTVVAEAVEAARPRARDRDIALELDAGRLPATSGDAGRIAQAIDNLISNAIKFTPDGGRVEVELGRASGDALITVRDTGVGISADEQGLLFERFFRSQSAHAGAIPGVGLGLTIVKAIVDGHGGSIEVDSEPGAGTTFSIRLPLRPPEAPPAMEPYVYQEVTR
jgi:signal transduction histidine kinase